MDVKQALVAILDRNQAKLEKIGAGGSDSFRVVDLESQIQSFRIENIRNTALKEFIQLAEQAKELNSSEYLNPYWTRTRYNQTVTASLEDKICPDLELPSMWGR